MLNFEETRKLATRTLEKLRNDPLEYLRFLKTAGNNYTYSFYNQVLIYAQMPEATAVADFATWKNDFKRYINKGTKGISLLDTRYNEPRVRGMYDYKDTNRQDGKEIYFWAVTQENKQELMQILEAHGYLTDKNQEIREITEQLYSQEDWEDITEDEIYRFIRSSVYAMLLARTNPSAYENILSYVDKNDFNLLSKLEENSLRTIGGRVKKYTSDVLNEVRFQEMAIRKRARFISLEGELIEKAKQIAQNDYARKIVSIAASKEMTRLLRIYASEDKDLSNKLIKAWEEQWQAAEHTTSTQEEITPHIPPVNFGMAQADIEKAIASMGDGMVDGKYRISEIAEGEQAKTRLTAYLSKEIGQRMHGESDGKRCISCNSKEMSITQHADNQKVTLKWSKVSEIIMAMVKENRYLTTLEKEAYATYKMEKKGFTEARIKDLPVYGKTLGTWEKQEVVVRLVEAGQGYQDDMVEFWNQTTKMIGNETAEYILEFNGAFGIGEINLSAKEMQYLKKTLRSVKDYDIEPTPDYIVSTRMANYLKANPKYVVMAANNQVDNEKGPLYIGLAENYDKKGRYDNSDGSLKIFENSQQLYHYVYEDVEAGNLNEKALEKYQQAQNIKNQFLEIAKVPQYTNQDFIYFEGEKYSIQIDNADQVTLVHTIYPLFNKILTPLEVDHIIEENPVQNAHLLKVKAPGPKLIHKVKEEPVNTTDDLTITDEIVENFFIDPSTMTLSGRKLRLYEAYRENQNLTAFAAVIKNEYKTDEESSSTERRTHVRIGHKGTGKGIEINYGGKYQEKHLWQKRVVGWDEAAQIISHLIQEGKYLTGVALGEETIERPRESIYQKTARKNSLPERNYKHLLDIAPDIIQGKCTYVKFEGSGYEPLYIEHLSEDTYAIAHTYIQDGDVVEITFRLDRANEMIQPLTYEMSGVNGTYMQNLNTQQEQNLNRFMNDWFKNIKNQGNLVKGIYKNQQGEEITLDFANVLKMKTAITYPLDKEWVVMTNGDGALYIGRSKHYIAPYFDNTQGDLLIFEKAENLFSLVCADESLNDAADGFRAKILAYDLKNGGDPKKTIDEFERAKAIRYLMSEEVATRLDGVVDATALKAITKGEVDLEKPVMEIKHEVSPVIAEKEEITKINLIGRELTIENRRFKIDSIDVHENVSMQDLSMPFPIFRSEPLSYVQQFLQEEVTAEVVRGEHGKKVLDYALKTTNSVVKEDVKAAIQAETVIAGAPEHEKLNFTIKDDALGKGGPKEKYQYNIAAIKTLQQIEAENRQATPQEQEILSKYVGWGGLADAFDSANEKWQTEYKELKALLTEEEYRMAKESVLSAYYTQPVIIRAMYHALDKWGFEKGNIIDPACGIGNFFGMLPAHMQANTYGVELDSLTGRIAKQLYQKNNITIQGFEETKLPDNFFDVAIGNVPFGQFGVVDKKYDKYGFMIHDYFFAKTLDKVRSGGVVAFISSKGTLDKKNSSVRNYLAERAEFLGAIRLPSDAFKANAGTEATADIIFLRKRDIPKDIEALTEEEKAWTYLDVTAEGIEVNSYFVDHPEMVMGTLEMGTGQYGRADVICKPFEDKTLEASLKEAIYQLPDLKMEMALEIEEEEVAETIPARPDVRNNSYTLVDDKVYYREDSVMIKCTLSDKIQERIRQMIAIRDKMREVIALQLENASDEAIGKAQQELNSVYDAFYKAYGAINSNYNRKCFEQDNAYCLIAALEVLDEENNVIDKSDIFKKRTIVPKKEIIKVETAQEALAVSMGEKACIDFVFMQELSGLSVNQMIKDLQGQIYPIPGTEEIIEGESHYVYEMADEYLSGNVRKKLRDIQAITKTDPYSVFKLNEEALIAVQPQDLTASEITAKLGALWIPIEYYTQFIHETMELTGYKREHIKVTYNNISNSWAVEGKKWDSSSSNATKIWGTGRRDAYEILEHCLNQKVAEITDTYIDDEGTRRTKKNPTETMKAQDKQDKMKKAFEEWIYKDLDRRENLCKIYNNLFNSNSPRQYSGKYINLPNMNEEIRLRPHQLDAVAHALYGGNTLFDHAVGAGKTYEMIATAMESKRLGLSNKAIIAVPNHLTVQVGKDFLKMFPAANILVADKKSFEKEKRKKFCSKIATGDWDAIIMGHTQLEKIPVSKERQIRAINKEIEQVEEALANENVVATGRVKVKSLEKTKKTLKIKLQKLTDDTKKDELINFEELGVDKLIVDEAHLFKNLAFYTKMQNISGVGGTDSQRATDLYLKCQYLDEKTNSKGIVFATGTPISNSMSELFVMQKYLYNKKLEEKGLSYFDTWAATFGEIETKLELKPEGTGYAMKSRFCKYNNIPELLSMFKEMADIKTKEMLNLPVPEVENITVNTPPSQVQKDTLLLLAKRAELVRNGQVDSSVDNMLVITNDGRKLALDQRLLNEDLPDEPKSKVNACVENIAEIYKDTSEYEGDTYKGGQAQVVFCDLSTPNGKGFNVYQDIKDKLIQRGLKEDEIAFIQDAGTGTTADKKKESIFKKVREGKIRVLIGSTTMMGTGANIQDKLYALHNLDCPWRPADIEQREGRIIRQGNLNKHVKVFKYITEGTFDAYMYQLIESKQRFISQIQNGTAGRTNEEREDKKALEYAEIKALATGNPLIKEKMDIEISINKLTALKQAHKQEMHYLEKRVKQILPKYIAEYKHNNEILQLDIARAAEHTVEGLEMQPITIKGTTYVDMKEATKAFVEAITEANKQESETIGSYRGFKLNTYFNKVTEQNILEIIGTGSYHLEGVLREGISKIDRKIDKWEGEIQSNLFKIQEYEEEIEKVSKKLGSVFEREEELCQKLERLEEVNALLDAAEKEQTQETQEQESETSKGYDIPKKEWENDMAAAPDNKLVTINQNTFTHNQTREEMAR